MRMSTGHALALSAAVLIGAMNVGARATTLAPLVLALCGYAALGALFARRLQDVALLARDAPLLCVMTIAGAVVGPVALFAGLQRTTATDASMLLSLEMAFTAALARVFLRERLAGRAWLGLGALFCAALLVGASATGGDASERLVGDLLVLVGAMGWAADNTASTALSRRYGSRQLLAVKGLAGSALLGALVLATGAPLSVPAREWPLLLGVGVLGIALSTLLFYGALKRIGATRTAGLALPTAALSGALGGTVALGEPWGLVHVAAAALIVAGVWVVVRADTVPAAVGAATPAPPR